MINIDSGEMAFGQACYPKPGEKGKGEEYFSQPLICLILLKISTFCWTLGKVLNSGTFYANMDMVRGELCQMDHEGTSTTSHISQGNH